MTLFIHITHIHTQHNGEYGYNNNNNNQYKVDQPISINQKI